MRAAAALPVIVAMTRDIAGTIVRHRRARAATSSGSGRAA
jgi:hypothetical protein